MIVKPISRIAVAAAALLLGLAFAFPLWRIALKAPQYPEGLGLLISVDRITGVSPNDLNSINNLNHYIGMKKIQPDDIPELRFMPWVLGALMAAGLGVAAAGRRGLLMIWVGVFAAGALAGIADFYKWGYDYGHNLAADAIIKVPGMTYQPPVIGTKQLLNFSATSWPAIGGWAAILALGIGITVLFLEQRRARHAAVAAA
jgi:copper chaperone NosL